VRDGHREARAGSYFAMPLVQSNPIIMSNLLRSVSLVLMCVVVGARAQDNPYSVGARAVETSPAKDSPSDFTKQFKYLPPWEWQKGMRFMVAPDLLGVDTRLNITSPKKTGYADQLLQKEWQWKIFVFEGFEERKDGVYLLWTCEGKPYEEKAILMRTLDDIKERNDIRTFASEMVWIDEVDMAKELLLNKDIYVLTTDWRRLVGDDTYPKVQKDGRQFVKVRVTQVGLNSQQTPVRIVFKAECCPEALIDVCISRTNQTMKGESVFRHFDEVFSFDDPRLKYPQFDEATWAIIQEGKVKVGMTAEACEVSWGKPNSINKTLTAGIASEQWVYGESYLYFENGLLTSIQN
jgi:hypothetical protein